MTKLQQFKDIAKILDTGRPTNQEVAAVVSKILTAIKGVRESLDSEIKNSARSALKDAVFTMRSIESSLKATVSELKSESSKVSKRNFDILKSEIAELRKCVDCLQNYDDSPLKEEIEESIEGLKNAIPVIKPLTGEEVKELLEKLTGDERLDAKSIKGLESLIKKANNIRTAYGGSFPLYAYENGVILSDAGIKKINIGPGLDGDVVDGVLTITASGAGGSNIATKQVTATESAPDEVEIDLSQLSNAYTTVQFLTVNGQIVDRNRWSIAADVMTVTSAYTSDAFQIQYTYA